MPLPVPRVFPVVHHRWASVTANQAELALSLGADGVFLIAHDDTDTEHDLIVLANHVARAHPDRLVGVNFLNLTAVPALELAQAHGLRAVWVDDPGITSLGCSREGERFAAQASLWPMEVFASVAFKYQAPDPLPGLAAQLVTARGLLPTTSGSGTGHAPEVAKIRQMRAALQDDQRLAIASGMDPENIAQFLPFATDFLVATGVSLDAHHFDPVRLERFIQTVHADR